MQRYWRLLSRATGGVWSGTQCAPHQQQEECTRELCHELAKCMEILLWPFHLTGSFPSAGPQGQSQPSNQEKTTQQGSWGWEGNVPGVGTGWGDARVPHLNDQAGTSHPPLAPHGHILPTCSSAAPSRISTYTQGHMNLRAGHSEMMTPHILKSILHKNL